MLPDVRLWPLADIAIALSDVCFWGVRTLLECAAISSHDPDATSRGWAGLQDYPPSFVGKQLCRP
jgi:hypothetical protein